MMAPMYSHALAHDLLYFRHFWQRSCAKSNLPPWWEEAGRGGEMDGGRGATRERLSSPPAHPLTPFSFLLTPSFLNPHLDVDVRQQQPGALKLLGLIGLVGDLEEGRRRAIQGAAMGHVIDVEGQRGE
jgi:hypothetical protein